MWGLCVSLLFLELQILEGTIGVQITPCTDSFVEVPAEKGLTLYCTPLAQAMEWRLSINGSSLLLAKLVNGGYVERNTFNNVFVASSNNEEISLTINTGNIKKENFFLVNGTVHCTDLTQSDPKSSNCALNYVYKPKANDISCTATDDPNGVKLSCTINNIYSSRGIYTCQALREKQHSDFETLDLVKITTSNDGSGLTVSGRCEMTTKLPQNPGNYSYGVKISPGEREVRAKLPGGGTWIEQNETSTNVASQASIYGVLGVWLVAALVLL